MKIKIRKSVFQHQKYNYELEHTLLRPFQLIWMFIRNLALGMLSEVHFSAFSYTWCPRKNDPMLLGSVETWGHFGTPSTLT